MLRKLRPRSVYDVCAAMALFVALGGTAYAVNTVGSTDIIDGQVKSVDIGNNEIQSGDVKDNSINTFDVHSFLGVDVVDNTLTGADINESTLNLPQTPTTATFAGQGNVQLDNNDQFTTIVTRNLPAGSYAIAATANIQTANTVNVAEGSYEAFCELRNHSGAFIGGGRDRRHSPFNAPSTMSLSMNGGVQIPAGGGQVGVHCKYVDGTTFSNTLGDAQMMIIRLDGFF